MNFDNSFRVMFEPFHSLKIDSIREWNYRQYIRSDNRDDKFLRPAQAILSGRIKHTWVDRFNRKVVARRRLIKDIRANLLLKWIKCTFPEIPIILLLRHPCAVANSKLKLGWDTHLNDFLIQEELMEDFLNPFKNEIEDVKDIFDKYIFMWCIENYVPLRQFNDGEILIVFYENLCDNAPKQVEDILSFIGVEFSSKVLKVVAKPSALSQKDSAIRSGGDLVDSWRTNISNQQIKRAVEILELFGLQTIYGEGDRPLLSGKEVLCHQRGKVNCVTGVFTCWGRRSNSRRVIKPSNYRALLGGVAPLSWTVGSLKVRAVLGGCSSFRN